MDPYCTDKFQWFKKYVEALEEERRKILVFKRELPFCLQLVTQAIDAWKHQMVTEFNSDYNETSNDGPVLEEFIPLKRSYEDTQQQQSGENHERSKKESEKLGKMPNWLRSVQLWNQEPDIIVKEDLSPKSLVVEKKKGAFNPFSRDKRATGGIMAAPLAVGAAASSTAETTGGGKEKEGEVQRKTRRCWSPELHRRFVHALRQLGGSHVATPKQIRELMKVDSLTNDEVKSHLQKYRLHMRRPSPTIQSTNAQATQFVFVGGIWVRPEFAAVAVQPGEVTGCAAQIYTPVAAPAVQMHYNHSEQSPMGPSHGTGNDHSIGDDANSFHTTTTTTTSSSSHVTTSPHF